MDIDDPHKVTATLIETFNIDTIFHCLQVQLMERMDRYKENGRYETARQYDHFLKQLEKFTSNCDFPEDKS